MMATSQLVFPHTVDGVGQAHQFQGAGTNDCGPTSLAIAMNLLALQKGFTTEPHTISKEMVAAAMQNESRWLGLRGYRITLNVFGFPTKGATFARLGLVKAFQDIDRYWQELGYASLGKIHFRKNGAKVHLLENVAKNRITAVRWVWENPYKNGSHWVIVVGHDAVPDEFLVLNPAIPHDVGTPEVNLQRVRWQQFDEWWSRPIFCSRNQMLSFQSDD